MELFSRRALILTGSIVLLVIVVYLLPVDVTQSLSLRGAVATSREWVLLRNDNGQIVSLLRDNRSGTVENYSIMQVERGDAMSFVLANRMRDGSVARGDTVGWITSYSLTQQITALEGELAVAGAELASARSGEKASLVEEARQRLAFAQAARSEQEKLHARQAELHAKNMISDELFDLSSDRLKQLRINVDLAEAGVRSATTGLKPEDIQSAEAHVASVREQLASLRELRQQNTLITPVSGTLRPSWAADTLLVIEDETEQLLIVPVRLMDLDKMRIGEDLTFTIPSTSLRGTARIEYIDRTVRYFGRRPVCSIIARIEQSDAGLTSGMMAKCTVGIAPVPLRSYIVDTFTRLFD